MDSVSSASGRSVTDRIDHVSPRAVRLARVSGVAGTLAFLLGMLVMVTDRAAFALDFAVFHLGGSLLRRDGYEAVYDRDLFRETLQSDYRPEADLADSLTYFISPPPFAWASQALSWLPFGTALVVWFLAGVVALFASVRLLELPWWAAAVVATIPAVVMNTVIGQSGLLFLLLAVMVHRAAVADKPVLAGLLVGLFVLKPPLAIGWALWWMLDWRRWNRALLAASFSSAILALPTLVGGGVAWRSFLEVMSDRVSDEGSLQVNSMSLAEFIKLLAPDAPSGVTIVVWLFAALVGVGVLRVAHRRWADDTAVLSAVAIVVTVGVSPHLSVYDTGLLLIPVSVLVKRCVVSTNRLTVLWAVYVAGLAFGPLWFIAQYDAVGRGVGLEFPALVVMAVLGARWLTEQSVAVLPDLGAVDGEREDLVVG